MLKDKLILLNEMTHALKEFNEMTSNEAFFQMYKEAQTGNVNPITENIKNKTKAESEVLKECLAVLDNLNIFHWRQNTGAFKTANGGFFRSSMAGVSDILGIMPDGRFLAIECKREVGGVVSTAQKIFLQNIVDNNGIAIVCNCAEQLKTILKGMIKDASKKNKNNA